MEVQSSFLAVPAGKGKYKLVCKLRSICVLDRSIEDVSAIINVNNIIILNPPQELNRERLQAVIRKPSPLRKVKRQVGYDDSDVEETGSDLKRMRM